MKQIIVVGICSLFCFIVFSCKSINSTAEGIYEASATENADQLTVSSSILDLIPKNCRTGWTALDKKWTKVVLKSSCTMRLINESDKAENNNNDLVIVEMYKRSTISECPDELKKLPSYSHYPLTMIASITSSMPERLSIKDNLVDSEFKNGGTTNVVIVTYVKSNNNAECDSLSYVYSIKKKN